MSTTRILYVLSLLAYTGLFTLLMLWYTWLAPAASIPRSLVILFFVGPLLFPLRGLLYGRPYTYAWTSFLVLIYFIHGVIEAYASSETRMLASLEIVFSSSLYFTTVFYARLRGRELKESNPAK